MLRLRKVVLFLVGSAEALAGQTVQYSRDVRPILSKNCFKCHGPDAAARKGELRLDVPGAASKVPILEKITATDAEERMPPIRSGKTLTVAEIEVLRKWVAQGAPYEKHWAFVAPRRPALPASPRPGDGDAVHHPIDRFVRARLAREGLRPSPPADRFTLVRRVYLDLIGLPPTPEQADAFVNDERPDAFEHLVDGLLASPRYGERWARRWLDLARYADSNGYEKDRERKIWSYRDWVIRALNADMPYDRFVIEQIAGDMLPGATPDQIVATGFHRNTMLNEEGGIDPLEFRFHAMADRVATTGSVVMGLTLGCAQCHTHKYDPITHTEYYGLMAFLNNADEPDYRVPEAGDAEKREANLVEARKRERELASHWPEHAGDLEKQVDAWIAKHRPSVVEWAPLRPVTLRANMPTLSAEPGAVVFASGDTTKHDTYHLSFAGADEAVVALRLEALPDARLPAGGPGMTYYEGRKGDFFLTEIEVRVGGRVAKIAKASHSYAKNRFAKKRASAELATDGDLQTGWSVAGEVGKRHVAVFLLERPIAAGEAIEIEMDFGRHFASSLGKFRVSTTSDTKVAEAPALGAVSLGESVERRLAMPPDRLSAADRDVLRLAFLMQAKPVSVYVSRIRDLRRAFSRPETLVMAERPAGETRPTYRHHRGEYLQKRERVSPRVPEALHPYPKGAPRNRLGFARWLVARESPFAARVAVNREWAAFFGRGIVRTLGDYGAQGAAPSHPALLDWLAVEFMDRGWSLKKLHRSIVLSETYRQDSRSTEELLARDPQNILLARAPRFRLEAEIIRDSALFASGTLSLRMFGRPVRPPQPAGVTEVAYGSPKWSPSPGPNRVRRSVYTFVKRTAPFAMYHTFDAPSGETCAVRRDVSNTALQALTLMNDPMLVEAAQAMGERLASLRPKSDREILVEGFRRVLTRQVSERELAAFVRFIDRQRKAFAADEMMAATVGGAKLTEESSRILDRAIWTSVARSLLCLDEAITRN